MTTSLNANSKSEIDTNSTNKKNRIKWVDCAKGIGILLVIVGHTVTYDTQLIHQMVRGGIYSFHMPLFFIMSGVTYRLSISKEQWVLKTERAFKSLIIPMLIAYGVVIIIDIINNHQNIQVHDYIVNRINALIYASGVVVEVQGAIVPALGALWFLVVLFLARTLYDYINLLVGYSTTKMLCLICVLAIGGVVISKYQWPPLSFDLVLVVLLPFIFAGTRIRTIDLDKGLAIWGVISIVVWSITLIVCAKYGHSYMELALRRYTLFPLGYVTALAGTMSVIFISTIIIKYINANGFGLVWLGRNSLYLYLIHVPDGVMSPIWTMSDNNAIQIIMRLIIDIVICILFVVTKDYVFQQKNHGIRR